jgi:hypothetical protein
MAGVFVNSIRILSAGGRPIGNARSLSKGASLNLVFMTTGDIF